MIPRANKKAPNGAGTPSRAVRGFHHEDTNIITQWPEFFKRGGRKFGRKRE